METLVIPRENNFRSYLYAYCELVLTIRTHAIKTWAKDAVLKDINLFFQWKIVNRENTIRGLLEYFSQLEGEGIEEKNKCYRVLGIAIRSLWFNLIGTYDNTNLG